MKQAMPVLSLALVVLAFIAGRVTSGGGGGEVDYQNYYLNAADAYDLAVRTDSPPADANDPERWAQVLALYRQVFDTYPDSEYADDALFAIASRIDVTAQADTAFALYRRILNRYPDGEHAPDALNSIGLALFQRGEYDRALVLFDQFLTEYPSSPLYEDVSLSRAVCQLRRGSYDAALAALEKFSEDFPLTDKLPAAMFYRGIIFHERQEFDLARSQFRNLIEIADPDYAAASQFNIGQTYFDEREFDSAIEAYAQTMELYPDTEFSEEAAFRVGWASERMKEYETAVAALRTAIATHPNSKNTPAAQVFMARIFLDGLQDTDGAVAAYRQIVDGSISVESIETDDRSSYDVRRNAQYQIGKIYEDRRDARAAAEYEALLKEFPEDHSNPSHGSNEIDEAYILELRADNAA
ncbi:MAG: tetratricopeptide repeat protein [Candidatus Poribacteria bacterium]